MNNRVKRGGRWLSQCLLILASATVLCAADIGTNDARLQSLGKEKLSKAKVGDKVDIQVEDGAAILSGSVDSIGAKERASKEVAKIQGIVSVANNLNIVAGNTDDQIAALAAHGVRLYPFYTIFDNIELSVNNGRLKITGQVTQPWRKTDIGRIVSVVPGVKEVENDLEVLPLSPFDNQLRMRIAMAIYRDPLLSTYGVRADPTIHIIVNNGNVTLTGVVLNDVDKAAAGRDARFAATYFNLDNQLRVENTAAKAIPKPKP